LIEPKSTDIDREVLYRSRHVRGPIKGFTHVDVEVTLNRLPVLARREDLEWADVADAQAAFTAAGLEWEMVTDDTMRVAGCLYWPKNGMFQRADGSKGSGGTVAFVRYIRGLPAVPPAMREAAPDTEQ
jgi:hypothetical protein